jgi:hypothetical protein
MRTQPGPVQRGGGRMRPLVMFGIVASLVVAAAIPAVAQVSDLVRNPLDGHYYEAVIVPGGISWSDARDAAESRSIGVVQGHLATITSQEESDFIVANFRLPATRKPRTRRKLAVGYR